jgi:hypothetical protein
MVKHVLAAVLLAGLGLSLAGADQKQPDAPKADPAAVTKLVGQLGSNRYDEREAACQALEALGPAALDGLRKAVASRDEETRRRAIDLVQRIEKRLESARLIQPKLVHLVYKDTPLTEAVQDMVRKSGFQIQLEGDQTKFAKRMITLDTGEVTFWQAVDQFCQKAGLVERGSVALPESPVNPVPIGNEIFLSSLYVGPPPTMPLVLMDGKSQSLPTHYAGAMRIRILPRVAPSAASANDGSPVNQSSVGRLLTVEVSPEPTLGLQNILSVSVDKVLDENGSELKNPLPYISEPVDYGAVRWARGLANSPDNGRSGQDLSKRVPIRLHVPDGMKKLKEIRGFVGAEVLTPHEPLITVEDILYAANKTVAGKDGGALKVIEVKRDDKGQVTLRVTVEKPPPRQAAFPPGMGIVFLDGGGLNGDPPSPDVAVGAIVQFLSLVDDKNQAFKLIAAEDQALDAQTNEYRLTYQPPTGAPKPAKLVYSGRRQTTIDVPFVLKDILLHGDKDGAKVEPKQIDKPGH